MFNLEIISPNSQKHRGYSFTSAIAAGLEPREYAAMWNEQPMTAEAVLDFKVWGKHVNLTCFFRDIHSSKKFCLSAFSNRHDGRYTPRDRIVDFSEPGIENGLYLVTTIKTRNGNSAWASAKLLLPPERREEILARIAEAYAGMVEGVASSTE